MLCTYVSGVLLLGLLTDSLLGWSWADPGAALVIAGIAVQEGAVAWRGDGCCTAPAVGLAGGPSAGGGGSPCTVGCSCG